MIRPEIDLPGNGVCMVMGYTKQDPKLTAMGAFSSRVNMEYCVRHGYGFRLYASGFAEDRHPSWSKLLFVRETLAAYPWAMWIDADAVVTNPDIGLERFLDDGYMVVVGRQNYPPRWNSVNCGVFFAKAEPDVGVFFDRIWEDIGRKGREDTWEQDGMRHVMDSEAFRSRVKVVCRRKFNSVVFHRSLGKLDDFSGEDELWRSGDFVAHYGQGRDDVLAAMRAAVLERGEAAVSAVMSTYCRNRPDRTCPNLLRRALDSVLVQTFEDWELVLVDDGSKDGSAEVCREYAAKDRRIRHVRFEENSGCPARRYNDGMRMARSPYFMFMFDDDYWYPHAMKCLMEAKEKRFRNCGMVYGLTDIMNVPTGRMTRGFGGNFDMVMLRDKGNLLGNLSVLVSRTAVNAVGGYDEDPLFRRLCDWDLWLRIGRKFKVGRVPVAVGRANSMHSDSVGKTVSMSDGDLEEMRRIQGMSGRKVRLQGELP